MNDDQELKTLGAIMANQNNRGTQFPLYAVEVDQKVYMPHSYGWDYDGSERPDTDEVEQDTLCHKCEQLFVDGQALPDDCDDCDPGAFNWYKLERVIDSTPGLFLTELGCQNHIDNNSYHYSNPRVYAVSAWRNYEMQAAMRHIVTAAGEKVPHYYL